MKLRKPAHTLALASGALLFTLGGSAHALTATQVDSTTQKAATAETKPLHDTVLEPSELQSILPAAVFFKGQSAPLQMRNASGVHFTDGAYLLTALVDTSGYSSGVQEKYQSYFMTEVALQIGEHRLDAGAYGVGFIAGNKFLVMDIGGHDLFTVNSTRDESLHHPVPLKIVQAPEAGTFRFYAGRMYINLKRAE